VKKERKKKKKIKGLAMQPLCPWCFDCPFGCLRVPSGDLSVADWKEAHSSAAGIRRLLPGR